MGDDAMTEPPRRLALAAATAVYGLVGVALLAASIRTDLRKEFFFDEAWRADIIRSTDPFASMRLINTPIPILWPLVLRVLTVISPDGFASLRLKNTVLSAGFPAFVGLSAQLAWLRRAGAGRRGAFVIGVAGAAGAAAVVDALGVSTYFNDYVVQAGLVAFAVAVWLLVDAGRARSGWLVVAIGVLGCGTLGGLMVVPGFLLMTVGRRAPAARQRRVILVGCVVAGVLSAGLYLLLYRHQVDRGLVSFWQAELLHGGTRSLADMVPHTLRSFSQMVGTLTDPVGGSVFLGALVVGLALVGMVSARRTNGWLWRLCLGAWVAVAAASTVAQWPFTAVRVNVPFAWLLAFAAVAGAIAIIETILRRVPRLDRRAISTAVAASVLVIGSFALRQAVDAFPPGYQPFARGLNRDLDVVTRSGADEIVVVGYHFMTWPYLHDRFINRDAQPGRYHVMWETADDPGFLYDDRLATELPRLGLAPGAEVWCVMPFEVGEGAERACLLDDERYPIIFEQNLERSRIIGRRMP